MCFQDPLDICVPFFCSHPVGDRGIIAALEHGALTFQSYMFEEKTNARSHLVAEDELSI